jgi:hypothetical protein
MFSHCMYIKPLSAPVDINGKCTISTAKSAPTQHILHILCKLLCPIRVRVVSMGYWIPGSVGWDMCIVLTMS